MSMRWSRREFVQWMGISSIASAGFGTSLLAETNSESRARFAYVAAKEGADEGIHAYGVGARGWRKLQAVQSARPVSLALAADGKTLYAVNEIDSHKGLPVGTVEAYAIETDGTLRLLNRQQLALSAIHPRHAAVTPDGRQLVVAVRGGGAYNVLPIEEDGTLGLVSGILKEVGADRTSQGRKPEPNMVAFDPAGRIVTVDGGTDRLSVLSLGAEGLTAQHRVELEAGCNPRQVVIHPAGEAAYVMRGGAVTWHRYDLASGRFSDAARHMPSAGIEGSAGLAVHPSGRFLYACERGGGLRGWNLTENGMVRRSLPLQASEMGELSAIEVSPDGRSLLGISLKDRAVRDAEIDPGTGTVRAGRVLARVDSPSSLVVLYS
ncbi:MAG TPA: beta-propeller fold lactonase family protein [Edaphobacter sp.]|nr:beta-propeller fold lactonase family protein [Edaphobacter sp.]